jgi:hypothetical protein
VDVLAQNKAGDTPFHLAAASHGLSSFNVLEVLRWISDKLGVTEEALKTLNSEGKMPFQLVTASPEARSLLKPPTIHQIDLPSTVGRVRVRGDCRAQLQSIEVKKLVALWSEFESGDE